MSNKLVLLSLLCFIFLAGCNNSPTDLLATDKLSYLNVGNKWVYSFIDFNPDGSIEKSRIDSMVIIGTAMINSEEYFQYDPTGFHRTDDDGLWFWDDEKLIKRLGIKYPSPKGDIWGRDTVIVDYGVSSQDREYLSIALVQTNTSITTEAGTFECITTEQLGFLESDGSPYTKDSIFVDLTKGVVKAVFYEKKDPVTNLLYKSDEMRLIRLSIK